MNGHIVLGRGEGEYNETGTDKVERNIRTQVMCIIQVMEKQGAGVGARQAHKHPGWGWTWDWSLSDKP